jgi:hypothetical protein
VQKNWLSAPPFIFCEVTPGCIQLPIIYKEIFCKCEAFIPAVTLTGT